MITQKAKVRQIKITILLIIAVSLYYWGYDICHALYNQYNYPVGSNMRKKVARQFWDLRFSNYSVIVAIVFYLQRFKMNVLNLSIAKIGFNLALFSSVDKLIFKSFDFSYMDKYVFIILILYEIYKNKKNSYL